jgi:hypothetical protein
MLQAGRSQARVLMRSLNFFTLSNLSSCTTVLGFTQPQTEMSTRNLTGGKSLPARLTDNLTAICECLENVGSFTSHNHIGLHALLQG